jgi:hypothetical protein
METTDGPPTKRLKSMDSDDPREPAPVPVTRDLDIVYDLLEAHAHTDFEQMDSILLSALRTCGDNPSMPSRCDLLNAQGPVKASATPSPQPDSIFWLPSGKPSFGLSFSYVGSLASSVQITQHQVPPPCPCT